MSNITNEIMSFLSAGILRSYITRDKLNIAQYGALTTLLLQNRVAFDTKYTPATGRNDAELTVTVYITPRITMDFSFTGLELTDAQ